jgi:hypothetical protein
MPSDQPTPADETERMQWEAEDLAAAAYERGKAEGRPSAADVATLRNLLMSLPYWPTEEFAALDRIEGVEPAEGAEPETEAPDA